MLEKKTTKYLTGTSYNALFIHMLVNTPTKVNFFLAVKGLPVNAGAKRLP
jgi:hypothetical protein